MVYRYIKKSIQSRGTGVLFLFLAVLLLIAGAYQVSDQLYVSGKSVVLATAHESGGNGHHEDTEPPVVTMLGDEQMFVPLGGPFVDPGAIAEDNVDGDISNLIEIDGDFVDVNTPGQYGVVYRVYDQAGNPGGAVRLVIIEDEEGNFPDPPDEPEQPITNPDEPTAADFGIPLPVISHISPSGVNPGDTVTVHGANYIDGSYVEALGENLTFINIEESANHLTFTVPPFLEPGEYSVVVKAKAMEESFRSSPRSFVVLNPIPPPFVEEEEEEIIEEEPPVAEEPPSVSVPEPLPPIEEPPFETFEEKKEILEEIKEEKKEEQIEEFFENRFDDAKDIEREFIEDKVEERKEIVEEKIEEILEEKELTREEIRDKQLDDIEGEIEGFEVPDFANLEFDEDFVIETKFEQKREQRIEKIVVNRKKEDFDFTFEEDNEEVLAFIDALVDEVIEEERLFEKRLEEDLRVDSDDDGISDYDEIVLYKTNPFNARTAGSKLTDGERILRGFDPLEEEDVPLPYENPQLDDDAVPVEDFVVEEIVVAETKINEITEREEIEKLAFSGRGLPNSFVTLYIFSTPIIVTVKTDTDGRWTYELEEELEDGQHSMYVATVDNAGKIVARSNPIPFVKTANAAELGTFQAGTPEVSILARTNFLFAMMGIAVVGLIIMILYLSFGMRREDAVIVSSADTDNGEANET